MPLSFWPHLAAVVCPGSSSCCHHFSFSRNQLCLSPAHQGMFSQRSILEAARSTGEKPEAGLRAAAAGRHKPQAAGAALAVRQRGMGGHGSTQTG